MPVSLMVWVMFLIFPHSSVSVYRPCYVGSSRMVSRLERIQSASSSRLVRTSSGVASFGCVTHGKKLFLAVGRQCYECGNYRTEHDGSVIVHVTVDGQEHDGCTNA
jgi:hypothetical protein